MKSYLEDSHHSTGMTLHDLKTGRILPVDHKSLRVLETHVSFDEMLLRAFTRRFIKLGIVPIHKSSVGMHYDVSELAMLGQLKVGDHRFRWSISAGMEEEDLINISLIYLDAHLEGIKQNGDFGKYFRTAGCGDRADASDQPGAERDAPE